MAKKLKLKTHSGTAKRMWKTGKGKLRMRQATQDHFNSRQRGKKIRSKRRDQDVAKPDIDNMKQLLPYL